MTDKNLQIIVLTESVWKSWVRDLSSFALFSGLIGLGILAESSAMQWAGFFVAIVIVFAKANGKTKRLTKREALEFLNSLPDEASK